MSPLASLRIALRALRINKLRSGLTMLGIVIGVAAVITMVAVGDGARTRVAEQIRSLGANLLLVRPGSTTTRGARLGSGSKPTLTEDDAAAIAREVAGVVVAAPIVHRRTQVVYGNANWASTAYGVTPDYLLAREWDVIAGHAITEEDVKLANKVALVGATVAQKLFGDGDPVGETIRLRNTPLTVVGVLARKGQNAWGGDQDDVVMVPLTTARMRIVGESKAGLRAVRYVLIKVYDEDAMTDTVSQIRGLLRQRHRIQPDDADDFRVRNLAEIMETRKESSRALTLLLAAVASVSLVVGGISIMNIMLVSVTERTREIGLRLAVGARRRDVRNQFLIEAITLSLVGGSIGILLGVVTAAAIGGFAGWPVLLRAEVIILAFGFAAAVGVLFGYYPAHKASLADPIEALRYE